MLDSLKVMLEEDEKRKKIFPLRRQYESEIKEFLNTIDCDNYMFYVDFRDAGIPDQRLSESKTDYANEYKGIARWALNQVLHGQEILPDLYGIADFMAKYGNDFFVGMEKNRQLIMVSNEKTRSMLIGALAQGSRD